MRSHPGPCAAEAADVDDVDVKKMYTVTITRSGTHDGRRTLR